MIPSVTARFSLKYMEVQGFYVNDLPGLVLDGRELEYLYIYIPPEARPVPGLGILLPLVEKTLIDYCKALHIPPFRILYLDQDGHGVCASTVPLRPPILLNMGEMTIKGEELATLYLTRVYQAEGSRGTKVFKYQEKLGVYTGVEKFLGLYMRGWPGMFHHMEAEERTRVFREFSPHHIIFTSKEWVDRPSLKMHLGVLLGNDKVSFRESVMEYPEATLEEVLSVK